MKEDDRLSKSDRLIMEIIWKQGETTSSAILKALQGVRDWSRHTVKTYLTRLIDKGFVGTKPVNQRKNLYYPLISKEAFLAESTSAFFHRNYDSLSHMVAGLLKRKNVSGQELEELEKLISEYKES